MPSRGFAQKLRGSFASSWHRDAHTGRFTVSILAAVGVLWANTSLGGMMSPVGERTGESPTFCERSRIGDFQSFDRPRLATSPDRSAPESTSCWFSSAHVFWSDWISAGLNPQQRKQCWLSSELNRRCRRGVLLSCMQGGPGISSM